MASRTLVERDKKDGKLLLRQLEDDDFPVTSAFWYYDSERDKWDLIIASRVVSERGPLEAYRKLGESVRRVQKSDFEMDSFRVRLVKEKDPLPSLLRKVIKTGDKIMGITFTNNVVDGTLIEDAYIYRSN